MKKRVIAAFLATTMVFSLAACGSSSSKEEAKSEEKTELSEEAAAIEDKEISWAKDNSGNAFLAIAEDQGWFDELGMTISEKPIDKNDDAVTAMNEGQIDIFSNYGTNLPLQQIAQGEDYLIIGGYMATGCMPIVAKKGTEWHGIEDFVGKKVADTPSDYVVTGALIDAGYDPLDESVVEFSPYPDYSAALAGVVKGEVDYAVVGTSRNYEVAQNKDLEVMAYKSDIMPWYSCCRMVVTKEYAEKNPNTVKAIIKTLLRGQQYYESHHDETVDLMVDYMGVEKDYAESYMNNEHFRISVDPLKHEVMRGWDILGKTGFLSDKASEINIEDHIAIDIYKEALDEAYEQYHDEDPDFWEGMVKFYEEHNL